LEVRQKSQLKNANSSAIPPPNLLKMQDQQVILPQQHLDENCQAESVLPSEFRGGGDPAGLIGSIEGEIGDPPGGEGIGLLFGETNSRSSAASLSGIWCTKRLLDLLVLFKQFT
jgi:hypothetical protein